MAKNRIPYLDLLRVLACAMIVLMHSPHPEAGIPGPVLTAVSYLTAPGIGIFFMVSGALLLPAEGGTFPFLRRRMGKILGPLLCWSAVYLVAKVAAGEAGSADILHSVASLPFAAQGHGVLWFMYTLTGLYLLAPLVSPMLRSATPAEERFYLALWVVTLCHPYLALVLDVNRGLTGILYYFTGYAGYFLLGCHLHRRAPHIPRALCALLFVLPVAALGAFRLTGGRGDFYDLFWYLSLPVAAMSVAWFTTVRRLAAKNGGGNFPLLAELSNSCFGIYLVHILVMRRVVWPLTVLAGIGGPAQILITWLLTFAASFVLTRLLARLPFAEYLVGYRRR